VHSSWKTNVCSTEKNTVVTPSYLVTLGPESQWLLNIVTSTFFSERLWLKTALKTKLLLNINVSSNGFQHFMFYSKDIIPMAYRGRRCMVICGTPGSNNSVIKVIGRDADYDGSIHALNTRIRPSFG
jgi:hypothetical protein